MGNQDSNCSFANREPVRKGKKVESPDNSSATIMKKFIFTLFSVWILVLCVNFHPMINGSYLFGLLKIFIFERA